MKRYIRNNLFLLFLSFCGLINAMEQSGFVTTSPTGVDFFISFDNNNPCSLYDIIIKISDRIKGDSGQLLDLALVFTRSSSKLNLPTIATYLLLYNAGSIAEAECNLALKIRNDIVRLDEFQLKQLGQFVNIRELESMLTASINRVFDEWRAIEVPVEDKLDRIFGRICI